MTWSVNTSRYLIGPKTFKRYWTFFWGGGLQWTTLDATVFLYGAKRDFVIRSFKEVYGKMASTCDCLPVLVSVLLPLDMHCRFPLHTDYKQKKSDKSWNSIRQFQVPCLWYNELHLSSCFRADCRLQTALCNASRLPENNSARQLLRSRFPAASSGHEPQEGARTFTAATEVLRAFTQLPIHIL
jgi:hypothetical protein